MSNHEVIEGRMSFAQNDEQLFTQLYLESYRLVYNYVRRRMNGDAAAEDVVSEAYLLAARSFHRFDPTRAKFSTWVIRIALNCMASHYRREREFLSLDEVPELYYSEEEEQDTLANQELVSNLFAVLSDEERKLVLMKYRDGKRNKDIAEELGMNASTVSTVLSRAIAKMRAVSEKECW